MRTPILVEAKVNTRWSRDFVHDQMANGRHFRILNIVDDVTRECLVAIPDTSISGVRVARELTGLITRPGKPRIIVSDNGTEFTSHAIFAWAKDHAVDWHYITPGKPMQNRLEPRSMSMNTVTKLWPRLDAVSSNQTERTKRRSRAMTARRT